MCINGFEALTPRRARWKNVSEKIDRARFSSQKIIDHALFFREDRPCAFIREYRPCAFFQTRSTVRFFSEKIDCALLSENYRPYAFFREDRPYVFTREDRPCAFFQRRATVRFYQRRSTVRFHQRRSTVRLYMISASPRPREYNELFRADRKHFPAFGYPGMDGSSIPDRCAE